MARPKAPKGFAQVRDDLGEHMTGDELVERMAGGGRKHGRGAGRHGGLYGQRNVARHIQRAERP